MDKKAIWDAIESERAALAEDLDGLTAKQWATPSLCGGWSVRDVVAHMTATAEMKQSRFLPKLAGAGFSLNRLSAKDIAARTKGEATQTLKRFSDCVPLKSHPPGPNESWLGETIVHAEDIRRPLKIAHDYPTDALIAVADAYRKSNLVLGGKKRVAGVTLKATDADWSAGSGPEVSGKLIDLVLAIAGRDAALAKLKGPGKDTLTARM